MHVVSGSSFFVVTRDKIKESVYSFISMVICTVYVGIEAVLLLLRSFGYTLCCYSHCSH